MQVCATRGGGEGARCVWGECMGQGMVQKVSGLIKRACEAMPNPNVL